MSMNEVLSAEVAAEHLREMAQSVSYRDLGSRLEKSVSTIVKEVGKPVSVEELRVTVNKITGGTMTPQMFRGLTDNLTGEYAKGANGRQTLHYGNEAALLAVALAITRQDIRQAYPDIKNPQHIDIIAKTVARFGQLDHPLWESLIPTVDGDITRLNSISPDILDKEIEALPATNKFLHRALFEFRTLIPPDDPLTLPEAASGLCSVLVDRLDPNFRKYIFDIAGHLDFGVNIYVNGAPSVILNAQGALVLGAWVVAKRGNGKSESSDKANFQDLALKTFGENHPWLKLFAEEGSETERETENLKKINIQDLQNLLFTLQNLARSAGLEEASVQKLLLAGIGIPQDTLGSVLKTLDRIYLTRQKTKPGKVVLEDMSYTDLCDTVRTVIDFCVEKGFKEECITKYLASGGKPKESAQ